MGWQTSLSNRTHTWSQIEERHEHHANGRFPKPWHETCRTRGSQLTTWEKRLARTVSRFTMFSGAPPFHTYARSTKGQGTSKTDFFNCVCQVESYFYVLRLNQSWFCHNIFNWSFFAVSAEGDRMRTQSASVVVKYVCVSVLEIISMYTFYVLCSRLLLACTRRETTPRNARCALRLLFELQHNSLHRMAYTTSHSTCVSQVLANVQTSLSHTHQVVVTIRIVQITAL